MKKIYFFAILLGAVLIVLTIQNMREEASIGAPFVLTLQTVERTLGQGTGLRLLIKNVSGEEMSISKGGLGKGPSLVSKNESGEIINPQNDLSSQRYESGGEEGSDAILLKPGEEIILDESFSTKDSPEPGQMTLNWNIHYFKNLKFGSYEAEASWTFDGQTMKSNKVDFTYKN